MGVREQLIRDCVLLGDFAEKSVETMKAGDEKGVVRLYTGASQANVLMPLLGLFGYIPFGIECLVITDAWMKRTS